MGTSANTLLVCLAACQAVSCLLATPISTCQDLNTDGCKVFQKADPEMCSQPQFGETSCKRYCGNCPIECYSCPEAIENPEDCNVTAPCDYKEICMYKHATVDGQSRHMFTCERKEICEGLTIGFGKRSTSDNHTQHDMAKDRMERRVNIDCCDSDYCNSPFGTTTTSTTQVTSTTTTTATTTTATTTTTTTTPKPKPTTASTRQTKHTTTTAKPTGSAVCFKDIVFVLDDSRSVGSNNFAHELDFVTRIVSQIHVGVQNAHVSVMTYDSHPQIQWYLNKYTNQRDVINAIHRVHYSGGHTYVNSALDAVRTNILNKNHGDRSSAANAVVVLTDGGTNSGQQSLTSHAHSLHAVTKDVVSIGIGQDVDLHGLNTIATDRSHMFVIHDFNHLHSILQNVINIICS